MQITTSRAGERKHKNSNNINKVDKQTHAIVCVNRLVFYKKPTVLMSIASLCAHSVCRSDSAAVLTVDDVNNGSIANQLTVLTL